MEKFASRKFIVAVAYFALTLATGFGLEIPAANQAALDAVILAYLGGQSFVDAVVAYKAKK